MNKLLHFVAIFVIASAFAALAKASSQATYTQVDYPGAAVTEIAGGPNLQGTSVGIYNLILGGPNHGFLRTAKGAFMPIDVPGATGTTPTFINAEGVIVGSYLDSTGTSHGFVFNKGTFTTISYPGAIGSGLSSINDLGEMSGFYCSDIACDASAVFHSFVLSRTGQFTSFDPPGATGSEPSTVSLPGVMVGSYDTVEEPTCTTQCLVYVLSQGKYSTLSYPGASFTFAGGGNVSNSVTGIYFDSAGNGHGFLENNGAYTSFDFPGASFTEATGINAVAVIVGVFIDSDGNEHGFVRTP